MSKVIVYGSPLSQPTRSVLWVCSWLGLKAELKNVNTMSGEHRSESFLRKNPSGKIPVLEISDEDETKAVTLWESHAEMRFLVGKYAQTADHRSLYPTDLVARAKVDAWLDWKHNNLRIGAAGIVRRRVMARVLGDISQHSMSFDIVEIPEERETRILQESLKVLEDQLHRSKFLADSPHPTLADIACATEVGQLVLLPDGLPSKISQQYPAVDAWHREMVKMPGYQESHLGFQKMALGIAKKFAKL